MRRTLEAVGAAQRGEVLSSSDASRVVVALGWGSSTVLSEHTVGRARDGNLHMRGCGEVSEHVSCDLVEVWEQHCSCTATLREMARRVEAEELHGALRVSGRWEGGEWAELRTHLEASTKLRLAVLRGVQGPESGAGELRRQVVTALAHRAGVAEDGAREWVGRQPGRALCAALGTEAWCDGRRGVVAIEARDLAAVRGELAGAFALSGCNTLARSGTTSLLTGSSCVLRVLGALVEVQRCAVEGACTAEIAEVAALLVAAGVGLTEAWESARCALAVSAGWDAAQRDQWAV